MRIERQRCASRWWLLLALLVIGGTGCAQDTRCEPTCQDRECGPDPACGRSCGDCAGGFTCQNGRCLPSSTQTYDVVIVGAGMGGSGAAIQAARMGMRVALLEESDWVGGQAVAVSTMDESVARERDSGIYKEWIQRIRRHYDSLGKSMGTCYFSKATHCFEPSVGQAALLGLFQDAVGSGDGALELMLRERVVSVIRDGETVKGVQTQSGKMLLAQVVVDATEYGDVIPLAKAAYRVGNSEGDDIDLDACVQDITYAAVVKKYPAGVPAGLFVENPPPGTDEERPYFARIVTADGARWFNGSYPVDFITHNAYRGLPDSSNPQDADAGSRERALFLTKTALNFANDFPAHAAYHPPPEGNPVLSVRYIEDPAFRREQNCLAKLRTLQFIHYMQHDLDEPLWSIADDEGFDTPYNREENLCPEIPEAFKALERHFPPFPYVRESRRLIGLHTLSARDIYRQGDPPVARTLFETAIALGGYINDLHNCRRDNYLESEFESLADVSPAGRFQVPVEALIPRTLDGFLPAEKNFSQTRLVNGATRLQPPAMLIGQAVGSLAAWSVRLGVPPRRVPAILVQNDLVNAGVELWVSPFSDVPRGDAFWGDVQLAAVRNIMRGYGDGRFGRDDPLLRGQMAAVLVRLLSLPLVPPARATFEDVPADHPFFAHVEAVAAAGLTSGCSADPPLFCPDAPTKRGQVAAFLARGLGLNLDAIPAQPLFVDVGPEHPFFRYVQAIAAAGLMNGCSAQPARFCPDDDLLRAQAAAVARRALVWRR